MANNTARALEAFDQLYELTQEILAHLSDMERVLENSQARTEVAALRVAMVRAWVDGRRGRKLDWRTNGGR